LFYWNDLSAVICVSASCPAGELVSVSLNEVVRLQCPAASQLSQQLWERPNSRLSLELYLHLEDGSLSFVATPATLGHYLCLSTENGYRQTMAIYHVKQKSSPMTQTPTSNSQSKRPIPTTQATASPGMHTSLGAWPKITDSGQRETQPPLSTRDTQVTTRLIDKGLTLWTKESGQRGAEFHDGEPLLSAQSPCYLKELVVVSVLLVLCLSMLITIILYVIRLHYHCRTAPGEEHLSKDSGKTTAVKQEASRGDKISSKLSGQVMHNEHVSGLICNGKLTGLEEHLPNTPI